MNNDENLESRVKDFIQAHFGNIDCEWEILAADDNGEEVVFNRGDSFQTVCMILEGINEIWFTFLEQKSNFAMSTFFPGSSDRGIATYYEIWGTTEKPNFNCEPPVPRCGYRVFNLRWVSNGSESFYLDDANFKFMHFKDPVIQRIVLQAEQCFHDIFGEFGLRSS